MDKFLLKGKKKKLKDTLDNPMERKDRKRDNDSTVRQFIESGVQDLVEVGHSRPGMYLRMMEEAIAMRDDPIDLKLAVKTQKALGKKFLLNDVEELSPEDRVMLFSFLHTTLTWSEEAMRKQKSDGLLVELAGLLNQLLQTYTSSSPPSTDPSLRLQSLQYALAGLSAFHPQKSTVQQSLRHAFKLLKDPDPSAALLSIGFINHVVSTNLLQKKNTKILFTGFAEDEIIRVLFQDLLRSLVEDPSRLRACLRGIEAPTSFPLFKLRLIATFAHDHYNKREPDLQGEFDYDGMLDTIRALGGEEKSTGIGGVLVSSYRAALEYYKEVGAKRGKKRMSLSQGSRQSSRLKKEDTVKSPKTHKGSKRMKKKK